MSCSYASGTAPFGSLVTVKLSGNAPFCGVFLLHPAKAQKTNAKPRNRKGLNPFMDLLVDLELVIWTHLPRNQTCVPAAPRWHGVTTGCQMTKKCVLTEE